MKARWCAIVLLMCAASSGAMAGGTSVAKYAGEFTSIGVGGRALGMGGAFVALANDVTAGYWNPAGLSHIMYPQAALMHEERFGSAVNYDYGAIAFPHGTNTSWGFSVIRIGVDDIQDTRNAAIDASGRLVDYQTYIQNPENYRIDPSRVTYFNAADWAFFFTYSKKQSEDFSYGASLKVIRRELGDASATGLGLDIGVWYMPMDNVMLGVNLQDITTTFLAWNTGTNELISPTMKIGSAYFIEAFGGRFAPAIDFDIRFENRKSASTFALGPVSFDAHIGTEFMFKNVVAFRVGYNDVKQVSFGAGLHLPKLSIDYSFARFAQSAGDRLDDTHRISLMFTLEAEQFRRVDGY
ncbi:MAG: PorV/PorQ family protein [Bacteroidetes bacterium]|nr:PorV/PorQ family protein [Bacteroidota bacterium]MCW5895799.1 PorV/PorQ family protein [Bacteroidota bacterium]